MAETGYRARMASERNFTKLIIRASQWELPLQTVLFNMLHMGWQAVGSDSLSPEL